MDDANKVATPAERQTWATRNNLVYGGLIAIGVVILQGFLTADALGVSGKISVIGFAIALPLLAVLIMIGELHGEQAAAPNLTDEAARVVALLSSVAGVIAAFWHIDWVAGVVVLIAGILGLGVYGSHFTGARFGQVARRRTRPAGPLPGPGGPPPGAPEGHFPPGPGHPGHFPPGPATPSNGPLGVPAPGHTIPDHPAPGNPAPGNPDQGGQTPWGGPGN
ncbi:hypothetical protein [Nocardia sp. NPDC050710]|uniref:hypothetical protein n=1 Tax=Nocardia sp. NPDC050710 TaxID=3157220 RepID=UPI00340D74AC